MLLLIIITLFFSVLTTVPHEAATDVFQTRTITFEITDYSHVKEAIHTKSLIQSNTFVVGSYRWVVQLYPRGINYNVSDYISIFVWPVTTDIVRATYSFRLFDWTTSTWSTDTPKDFTVRTFVPYTVNASWGFWQFILWNNLEYSNYVRNDTLLVKTTVWVVDSRPAVLSPLPSANKMDVVSVV